MLNTWTNGRKCVFRMGEKVLTTLILPKSSLKERNNRMVATELFSQGVCNLNCSYCYIPKNDFMKAYHDKIVKSIEDDSFIDLIEKAYGKGLQVIGLWGTEPTLVAHLFARKLDKYIKAFPELSQIGFSSNLYAHPERIVELTKAMNENAPKGRKFTLNWQVSLDGPAWVTDVGRGKGVTDAVVNNIKKYFKMMEGLEFPNVRIIFNFKPTVSLDSIREMNEDFGKLIEWFRFYDDVVDIVVDSSQRWKTEIQYYKGVTPTLVVPGKYSVQDGKDLAKFFKNLRILEKAYQKDSSYFKHLTLPFNNYVGRFASMIDTLEDIGIEPANSTCSGGDTNFGMDLNGNMHICHRTFLYNEKEYLQDILSKEKNLGEEWEVSNVNEGILRNLNRFYTTNVNSPQRETDRFSYVLRGYHDTLAFKFSTTVALIQELAMAGQASEEYLKNEDLAFMLSLFLNTRLSCPSENLLQSGSTHLQPVSLVRLFANGAFELMVQSYLEDRGMM